MDGISLVTTYRSTFAEEVNKSGVEGLIKTLQAKNRSPEPPTPVVTPKS